MSWTFLPLLPSCRSFTSCCCSPRWLGRPHTGSEVRAGAAAPPSSALGGPFQTCHGSRLGSAGRRGLEHRAALLPHWGDLQSLALCVAPRCVVVVVLSLMWSPCCHKCHCAECRGWCEAAWWRPTEAAGTSLSQQWGRGGGRLGAALSVTRSHEAEVRSLLLSADRGVVVTSCSLCCLLTDVTLSRWSRAAWSRRGCWHATDCGLAPAAARSLAPAARSHRWRLARQRGPAHAHHGPHILLALGQAGGRLGRGGGRTRD